MDIKSRIIKVNIIGISTQIMYTLNRTIPEQYITYKIYIECTNRKKCVRIDVLDDWRVQEVSKNSFSAI